MSKDKFFISEALCLPLPAIEYHIGQDLATLFPNKAMIEGEEGYFNVEEFAHAQHCTITLKTFIHNQLTTYWVGPEPQIMHYHAHVVMAMGGVIVGTSQIPQTSGSGKETIDRVKNAWLEVEALPTFW